MSNRGQTKRTTSELRRWGWSRCGHQEPTWPCLQPFLSILSVALSSIFQSSRPQRDLHVLGPQESFHGLQVAPALVRIRVKSGYFASERTRFLAQLLTNIGATCKARRDGADSWAPKANGPLQGSALLKGQGNPTRGVLEKGCKRPSCLLTQVSQPPRQFLVQASNDNRRTSDEGLHSKSPQTLNTKLRVYCKPRAATPALHRCAQPYNATDSRRTPPPQAACASAALHCKCRRTMYLRHTAIASRKQLRASPRDAWIVVSSAPSHNATCVAAMPPVPRSPRMHAVALQSAGIERKPSQSWPASRALRSHPYGGGYDQFLLRNDPPVAWCCCVHGMTSAPNLREVHHASVTARITLAINSRWGVRLA